jgi:hypothetical protein
MGQTGLPRPVTAAQALAAESVHLAATARTLEAFDSRGRGQADGQMSVGAWPRAQSAPG